MCITYNRANHFFIIEDKRTSWYFRLASDRIIRIFISISIEISAVAIDKIRIVKFVTYSIFSQVWSQPAPILVPLMNNNTPEITNKAICIIFPPILK